MGSIFGGEKSKTSSTSHSFNNAWPQIKDQFSSTAGQTGQATNALSALLGLGGDPAAQDQAFNNYKDSTGYNFKMQQGQDAITGSAAAKGLLDSGSTAKGLTTFGQNLGASTFNDYLSQLFNLSNTGLQAGGLLSDAGKEQTQSSTGSSSKKNGLGATIGFSGGSVGLSDRRLKQDIVKLYEREDGLGVYEYRYLNGATLHKGVMADEVARLKPEALGPVINGFSSVDYAKIGEL